jgi:hypothetical protein
LSQQTTTSSWWSTSRGSGCSAASTSRAVRGAEPRSPTDASSTRSLRRRSCLLAVSGADYAIADSKTTITPFGLHVIDTRTWTIRTIDRDAAWAQRVAGVLLVTYDRADGSRGAVAWGADGSVRYRLPLGEQAWPNIYGTLAYVCQRDQAVRVLDAATGATIATPKNRTCVTLLGGDSSSS